MRNRNKNKDKDKDKDKDNGPTNEVFLLDDLIRMREDLKKYSEKRPVLYYAMNRFLPERNEKGDVVYFRIPTSTFAMDKEEKSRIVYPKEIYLLHPKNLIYLEKRAIDEGFVMEEWDWGKTELRPHISDDMRGI